MEVVFTKELPKDVVNLVFPVFEELDVSTLGEYLDKELVDLVTNAVKVKNYKNKKGSAIHMIVAGHPSIKRLIIVGCGKASDRAKESFWHEYGGCTIATLKTHHIEQATIYTKHLSEKEDSIACHVALGASLRNYAFTKYYGNKARDDAPLLNKLTVVTTEDNTSAKMWDNYYKFVNEAVFFTRDLISEPPNVLYPESYAKICEEMKQYGLEVEILDKNTMKTLGMNAILAVGQGSDREARLVVLKWHGDKDKNKAPLAFVGKGVTFDSGGISIKPSNGMEDMKYDMGGSGVVVGLMRLLASRKAKVNAVGIMALVENMPSGKAARPSDVVKAMSGHTIEIVNTDAEGRVILADALHYCIDRFNPELVVDLATLTGAIVVCLGGVRAGLFSNDDDLADKLSSVGEKVGEKLWRMPIDEEYDKQIDSVIADVQNVGKEKGAGSITAAKFLQRFVGKAKWAHLDIAGVTWATKDKDLAPKGATAFGVRLLDKFIQDYYEN